MSSPVPPPAAGVGPLFGVRVVDMSRLLPGPFATQLLADMGAEVIKVEDPEGGGDYARAYPPLMNDGSSAIFHALNRGKLSVALDLKRKEDLARFHALLATADVLVETFRPGVLAKLGASPAALAKRYPGLIICSISGYGQTGPDALRAGHDVNYLAKAGALGVMEKPALLPVQVADIAGGSYPAAVQILAALRHKEKTGKGAVIDVSMTDNVYALLQMPLARHSVSGSPFSGGRDWLTGGTPCYDVYATDDGHISVGSLEPKFWSNLCQALQREDLIPRQFPDDPKEIAEVKGELQKILKQKNNAHWAQFFEKKDCCVEIVELPENLDTRSPQLAARDVTLRVSFPAGTGGEPAETLRVPRMPLRMTGLKDNTRPAPKLGEHTQQLLPSKL